MSLNKHTWRDRTRAKANKKEKRREEEWLAIIILCEHWTSASDTCQVDLNLRVQHTRSIVRIAIITDALTNVWCVFASHNWFCSCTSHAMWRRYEIGEWMNFYNVKSIYIWSADIENSLYLFIYFSISFVLSQYAVSPMAYRSEEKIILKKNISWRWCRWWWHGTK